MRFTSPHIRIVVLRGISSYGWLHFYYTMRGTPIDL